MKLFGAIEFPVAEVMPELLAWKEEPELSVKSPNVTLLPVPFEVIEPWLEIDIETPEPRTSLEEQMTVLPVWLVNGFAFEMLS